MTYEAWEASVPEAIRSDSLWRMEAYRLGLFLADLAWCDSSRLLKDRRTFAIADQIFRAAGKVSSNIGEGYSRGTGKDRAHFYEYALGSLRETRDWYYKSRHVLGEKASNHRIELCSSMIRLVLRMISRERASNRRVSPKT